MSPLVLRASRATGPRACAPTDQSARSRRPFRRQPECTRAVTSPCIVKQYWTVSGLARLREGVLAHTMLTHTILTHTVLTCVLHLGCAVAGPAAARPPPLLWALGPACSQPAASRETAQGARARRLARGACGHSRNSRAAGRSTAQCKQRRGRGRRRLAAVAARRSTLPPLAHADACATLAAAAKSSADANNGAEHAQLK